MKLLKYAWICLFLFCLQANSCKAQEDDRVYHTVKEGETFQGIADMFGVSVLELKNRNKTRVKDINKIRPGDKIYIGREHELVKDDPQPQLQDPFSPNTEDPQATPDPQEAVPIIGQNKDPRKKKVEIEDERPLDDHIKGVLFLGKWYLVAEFDPANYNIELFNKMDARSRQVHDFTTVDQEVRKTGEKLVLAMNGGMFNEYLEPVGLYISKGEEVQRLNLSGGRGNFYDLLPNGVFWIDEKNTPMIMPSREFDFKRKKNNWKINMATQSGPMMVINGEFNEKFREGSTNLNIRNGVGINEKGNVVFVISQDMVNFYEFSQLYRDALGCKNALYFDGVVSQWFSPDPKISRYFPESRHRLGPILAITKK